MRGIIRKAFQIDSVFWIIVLSALVIALYVIFGLPNADAVSRSELAELKAQEKTALQDIENYDVRLEDQRESIKNQEKTIDDLKNELRELSGLGDWSSIEKKINLENQHSQAVQKLDDLRDELGEILREKSDMIKFLNGLDLTVEIDNVDLSHLTPRIGIALSKSCETMLKNSFETVCPTYKHLIQLDSSNTDISGKFTTDDDGFFHRGPEAVPNSYKYYWNDDQIRIFVDPPASMINRIKMIYIEPNFDTYTVPGDMTVHDEFEMLTGNYTKSMGNQTELVQYEYRDQTAYFGTVLYHDRYIDRCSEAVINANEWKKYMGDTIHLMRNNCDRTFTSFEERKVILPEYSVIDITTSPNWIYQQWLKHTEEFCIFKYKQC